MGLSPVQWLFGIAAALLTGFSKTGMPGVGILVVPLLAVAFGGRASVGTMLPMLLFGDVFAVRWYRRHADWDKLLRLLPWVALGMLGGYALLWVTGEKAGRGDALSVIIGWMVLAMLGIHLARSRWGEKLTPRSPAGIALAGGSAGFTTTASNAAGPIMSIYLSAMEMPKERFMGTTAWFFFLVNAAKLPLFFLLSLAHPNKPMMTGRTLLFDLAVCPVILAGVLTGRWFLPRVSQRAFDGLVLLLAGIAAIRLILG